MPKVKFTSALTRFFPDLSEMDIQGETIQEIVKNVEKRVPGISDYILEEDGSVRKHVNIFLGEDLIKDRSTLTDTVAQNDQILIYQALIRRMKQRALIGTSKGLVVYDFSSTPTLENVHFSGYSVNQTYVDQRNGRWWIGVSHKHWGQKLHYSDNEGSSWETAKIPSYDSALLPDGKKAKLKQIWTIAAGGSDQKEVIWVGTEPGGLFKSEDFGNSFTLVESLWNHPSRKDQTAWFGAGTDQPFIHSINVDPSDSKHLYVSISCAGVFETKDAGKSWKAKNNGLIAAYLPNPKAEYGHDPHKVILHPKDPNVLWQQNHCGVFISRDAGNSWQDVSDHDRLPSYGFGIVVDEEDPARAWVIPVESDEKRVAPDLKLRVMRTDDYGANWKNDSQGLPSDSVFDIVLRHAFDRSGDLMVFGTNNGNFYYKRDSDNRWYNVTTHLSKINSVITYKLTNL